ncbi:MAG TPA: crossover junction endodeoxyribonuclease RuvC [Rhodothermales bacterium]
MLILGIDPGSRFTGYGLIECDNGVERVLDYGVVKLDETDSHALRLKHIYDRLLGIIEANPPDECAVEMPVYANNAQSMLKLGRAQAAAMLAVLNRQIPVTQYSPKEVKKSVTGNGNASKQQVWYMVRSILTIDDGSAPMGTDAADALAVGLCHAHRSTRGVGQRHAGGWARFVRDNPDRIRG